MFTMCKIKAARQKGKSFYHQHLSANDYYSEKESISGVWKGNLAEEFQLSGGRVSDEQFSMFQQNINPVTEKKLTQRTKAEGIRFYDFQCSAQKSVSVMSLWDRRLVYAHQRAVDFAMKELENFAAVRMRKGNQAISKNCDYTSNIIYAQFHHDSSRALDPQLHAHNVVVNVTKTPEGEYKALETLEMCKAIRYAGKAYQNYLAAECRSLGYDIQTIRNDKGQITGFEIAGIPSKILQTYSKRRQEIENQIEEFVKTHGRSPTIDEINTITRVTRGRKMTEITKAKVIEYQKQQLSPDDQAELLKLQRRATAKGLRDISIGSEKASDQIRRTLPHIFEREGVLKQDKVLAEVLNQNLGYTNLDVLKSKINDVDGLVKLENGNNPHWSTHTNIDLETYIVESVDQTKGIFKPMAPNFKPFASPDGFDHASQIEVIKTILNSQDRFNLFRGVAGAGKTSTLTELCQGFIVGGIKHIQVIAPTNSAVSVLRKEGFDLSSTVARFINRFDDPEYCPPPSGETMLIIDESGLNSLKDGSEIMRLAKKHNYRVLFVGDAKQHSSVAAGDFFRLLETYSEINKVALTDIHRQQIEEYRKGIYECALGNFQDAFDRFNSMGWINEGKANYIDNAAASYLLFTDQGKDPFKCIAVAPTHAECDRLTESIRNKLKDVSAISSNGYITESFQSFSWTKDQLKRIDSYQPGQQICFIRAYKDIASPGEVATIKEASNSQLYLSNGKKIDPKYASEFIDVGQVKQLQVCRGDILQIGVNIKELKIHNGMLAVATETPQEYQLLDKDNKPMHKVKFHKNFGALRYGWVTTSHKSQGRTSENVVVAAENLDKKAFYVSLSRGKQHMMLHCPDKQYLQKHLSRRDGDRTAALDLLDIKSIQAIKQDYLKPETRKNTLLRTVKKFAAAAKRLAEKIAARNSREKHISLAKDLNSNKPQMGI